MTLPDSSEQTGTQQVAPLLFCAAVALFPLLLLLPVDLDKSGYLVLLPGILASCKSGLLPKALPKDPWLRSPLLGLILIITVSTLCAKFQAPAIVSVAGWALLFVSIASICNTPKSLYSWLLRSVVIGGGLGYLLVIWTMLTTESGNRMPVYSHPRLFGMHMFVAAIASVYFLCRKRVQWFDLLLSTLVWTGLFWSGSRSPWVGLIPALALWFYRGSSETRKKLLIYLPIILVLSATLSYAFRTNRYNLGWGRAVERSLAADDMNALSSSRLTLWSKVWEASHDSPWIGIGPDGYRHLRPKLDGEQPHDFLLHWRLELGWAGLLVGCLLLGKTLKRVFTTSCDEQLAAGCCLLACTCSATLDGIFYHLLTLIPVVIFVALIWGRKSQPFQPSSHFNRWIPLSITVLAVSILSLHSYLFYRLVAGAIPRPKDPVARVLRAFPSTTYGLWAWTHAWESYFPDETLEWTLWAQKTSYSAAIFHGDAARIYLKQGRLYQAAKEYKLAMETCHHSAVKSYEKLYRMTLDAIRQGKLNAAQSGDTSASETTH